MTRILFTTLILAGIPTAQAIELPDAESVERVCAFAAPVSDVWQAAGTPGACDADAPVEMLVCEASVGAEAEAARTYARSRSHLLVQAHEVQVASGGFALPEYNPDLGLLTVPLDGGVNLFGGVHEFVVGPNASLTFEVSESEAEHLQAMHQLGALTLRLVFSLGHGSPDTAFCLPGDDGDVQVLAQILAAELIESHSGESSCRTETPHYTAVAVRSGVTETAWSEIPAPLVQVTSTTVEGESLRDSDMSLLQGRIESALSDCYVRGLFDNGRLQGALVFDLEVAESGRVTDGAVRIDALNSPEVAACAVGILGGVSLPPRTTPAPMRMTVVFRLE